MLKREINFLLSKFSLFSGAKSNQSLLEGSTIASENLKDSNFDSVLINDVKKLIFQNVSEPDLKMASQVNSNWYIATSADEIWRERSLELGPNDDRPHKFQYRDKRLLLEQKAKLLERLFQCGPPGYEEWTIGTGFAGIAPVAMNNREKFLVFDVLSYLKTEIFNDSEVHAIAIIDFAIHKYGLKHDAIYCLDDNKHTLLHFLTRIDIPELLENYVSKYASFLNLRREDANGNSFLSLALEDINSNPKPDAAVILLKHGALLGAKEIAIVEKINIQSIQNSEKWQELFFLMIERGLDENIVKQILPEFILPVKNSLN